MRLASLTSAAGARAAGLASLVSAEHNTAQTSKAKWHMKQHILPKSNGTRNSKHVQSRTEHETAHTCTKQYARPKSKGDNAYTKGKNAYTKPKNAYTTGENAYTKARESRDILGILRDGRGRPRASSLYPQVITPTATLVGE